MFSKFFELYNLSCNDDVHKQQLISLTCVLNPNRALQIFDGEFHSRTCTIPHRNFVQREI